MKYKTLKPMARVKAPRSTQMRAMLRGAGKEMNKTSMRTGEVKHEK